MRSLINSLFSSFKSINLKFNLERLIGNRLINFDLARYLKKGDEMKLGIDGLGTQIQRVVSWKK